MNLDLLDVCILASMSALAVVFAAVAVVEWRAGRQR